jgi:hypothetical protein
MPAVPELNVIATGDGLDAYVVKTSVPPTVPVAGAAQVITGVALTTVTLRVTWGAAFQFVSPTWLPFRVQVPAVRYDTEYPPADPLTVQTDGVAVVIATGRAVTASGETAVAAATPVVPTTGFGLVTGEEKEMIWSPFMTVTDREMDAAANTASPT